MIESTNFHKFDKFALFQKNIRYSYLKSDFANYFMVEENNETSLKAISATDVLVIKCSETNVIRI